MLFNLRFLIPVQRLHNLLLLTLPLDLALLPQSQILRHRNEHFHPTLEVANPQIFAVSLPEYVSFPEREVDVLLHEDFFHIVILLHEALLIALVQELFYQSREKEVSQQLLTHQLEINMPCDVHASEIVVERGDAYESGVFSGGQES